MHFSFHHFSMLLATSTARAAEEIAGRCELLTSGGIARTVFQQFKHELQHPDHNIMSSFVKIFVTDVSYEDFGKLTGDDKTDSPESKKHADTPEIPWVDSDGMPLPGSPPIIRQAAKRHKSEI